MISDELQVDKGGQAEEVLRSYFLSQGYYVVRGVPFPYQGFDVTDIDLWLYLRPSSLTRERCCVDIKRKKTPQALERVFWTKGLREVLGMDRAIVVTTDNRPAVRNFGAANEVTVLHGEFLQRLVRAANRFPQRISEEAFPSELRENCLQAPR
jgi:Restriction endonuclease